MNRRGFLRALVGGVATATAVRTFPFRVFSFPSEIVTPPMVHISEVGVWDELTATTLEHLKEDILYDNFFIDTAWIRRFRTARELEFVRGEMSAPFGYS